MTAVIEKIYDLWLKRNPEFEVKYEPMLRQYCEYGKGTNDYSEARAKILGAGYELYIMAFFIGLYAGRDKKLTEDPTKRKSLGQPLQYWGNFESRKLRRAYPRLREYIFMGLVARTDVDYLAVDKGDLLPSKAVAMLVEKMEEYANFGFDYIQRNLEDNPNWLMRNSSLLNTFLGFTNDSESEDETNEDDEPDSLD